MTSKPSDVGDLRLATIVVNSLDLLVQHAQRIPADPAPVHIDLYTKDRDQHIDRLVKLGATVVDDWDYPDEHDFIVLRDPDGNEFCVIHVEP